MDIKGLFGGVFGSVGTAKGAAAVRSSNQFMRWFARRAGAELPALDGARLTVGGVAVRTGFLLLAVIATASFAWHWVPRHAEYAGVMLWASLGGALLFGIIASLSLRSAAWAGTLYALCEGLLLGVLSFYFGEVYGSSIVTQAVVATFAVAGTMLVLYASRLLRVTSRLRRMVRLAIASAGVFYLVSLVSSLLGFGGMSVLREGLPGVVVSLLMIGIASFSLVLDFDQVERAAEGGVPKQMEWMAAFGLVASLVWLYLEVLRLLAVLRR